MHSWNMLSVMYEEDAENHMAVICCDDQLHGSSHRSIGLIGAVFVGTFLPIFLMGPKMMQSGI